MIFANIQATRSALKKSKCYKILKYRRNILTLRSHNYFTCISLFAGVWQKPWQKNLFCPMDKSIKIADYVFSSIYFNIIICPSVFRPSHQLRDWDVLPRARDEELLLSLDVRPSPRQHLCLHLPEPLHPAGHQSQLPWVLRLGGPTISRQPIGTLARPSSGGGRGEGPGRPLLSLGELHLPLVYFVSCTFIITQYLISWCNIYRFYSFINQTVF